MLSDRLKQLAAEATARDAEIRHQRATRAAGDERWYLTHIGARSDDRAITRLIRCEFELYRPQMWRMMPIPRNQLPPSRRKDACRPHAPRLVPLLGKYLFVHFDLRRADWRDVFDQAGIWGIQGFTDAVRPLPAPISDKVIASIKAREVDGGIPAETPVRQFAFEIGEIVRVTDTKNPFYGREMPVEDLIPRELLSKRELADIDDGDAVALTSILFNGPHRVLLPLSAIGKAT